MVDNRRSPDKQSGMVLYRCQIRSKGEPVNKDELRLVFVGLRLQYPQQPRFAGTTLKDLFATICKRHSFEAFDQQAEEGATFSAEGIRELHISRDRLSVEEDVTVSFDLLKRNFADQVKIVQEALTIPGFYEPRLKLRAVWPVPGDEENTAVVALRDRAFNLKQDQYDELGVETLGGIGLVINADLAEHSHLYLELTPYVRDPSQLHIDVESYSHQTIDTPEVIEARLDELYEYFTTKLARFIQTFMP